MAVKIGCCGFPVSQVRYGRQFSVQTFYQVPAPKTLGPQHHPNVRPRAAPFPVES